MQAPEPTPEHRWLSRLLGEWTYTTEPVPGMPPYEMTGSESVRGVGDLWVQCVSQGGGGTNQMTLGFEPRTGRFVGTFLGSMGTHLWVYDGQREGDRLLLESVGPSFSGDGAMARYRDEIELVSEDERVLRAFVEDGKGGWTPIMQMRYRRV